MDELEGLHVDRTNVRFYHYESWGRGLESRKSKDPHPYTHISVIY